MSNGFSPPVTWKAGEPFDFTLVFEFSIFSILSAAIFVFVAIQRIIALLANDPAVGGRYFQCTKLGILVANVALQAALVALWSASDQNDARLGAAAASAGLVLSVLCLPLSWLQHQRSPRPSSTLVLYFSLSVLGDIFHTRTLWLQEISLTLFAVAVACCVTKCAIAVLESVEKRKYLLVPAREYSPGDLCSLWNRVFYVWLNPIFFKGYQQALSIDDLHPLQEALHSGPLSLQFNNGRVNDLPPGRFGLALALVSSLRWELLYPVPARVLLIGFTFCQPLLIKSILEYLEQARSSSWPDDTDNFLLAGMALAYLGMAVSSSLYSYIIVCLLAKVRSMLVSSVYRKVMELPSTSNDKAAVTLMSTDVERVTDGLRSLHDIWAEIAEVGIAIWLLERELGVGAVGPVVLAILCFMATVGVNKFTMARQSLWMKALEKRVGSTSSVLSSVKGIKMTGLSEYSSGLIRSLRVAELASAKGFRTIMATTFCIAFTPKYLSPVLCFGIHLGIAQRGGHDESFDASKAFTSLSIVILLTSPLSSLFQYVTPLLGALNCLERIQQFLRTASHSDPRSTQHGENFADKKSIVWDEKETSEKIDGASAVGHPEGQSSNAFVIQNGQVGWNAESHILENINVTIPRGKLTMVVGPVASGKSTLCKALLGEATKATGVFLTCFPDYGIGYCDQIPFLTNATVRQNIVGYSPIDEKWYQTVIHALTLDEELQTFALGDGTMVGSNGIGLSTGQRQRVAMARAVYARKSAVIFDDVFSGMDNITKSLIFDRLLARDGLLRISQSTVVMVTHDKTFLKAADHIILLQPGQPPVSTTPEETISQWDSIEQQNPANDGAEKEGSLEPVNSNKKEDCTEKDTSAIPASAKAKPKNMSDWRVYKYYAGALGVVNVVLMLSLGVAFAFLFTFPSIWIKWWTENSGNRDNFYLGIYAMLQGIGMLSWFLFTYHILTTSITASGLNLHGKLLKTAMSMPLSFLTKKDTGAVLNRFSQDLEIIDGELPGALLNTLATALIALSQIAMITTASPWIATSYPFVLLLFYGIQKFYLRTSQQLRPMDLELKSPLYTHFLDTIRGISTIRSFGWCQQHIEHNQALLDTSQRPAFLMSMVQQWLSVVLKLVILGLAVALTALALKLRSTSGFTGVALVNLMSLNEMIMAVLYGWMLLETSISAVCRVKEFEEQTPQELDEESLGKGKVGESWPPMGKVECNDLKASYGPNEETMALKSLSLTIDAGKKVGICGRSGSGKSSLLASLFRMLDIREGQICIDSVNIQSIPLSTLRSRINAIPQDPFFIPGTFRENIDPLRLASLDAIQSALEKVLLWEAVQKCGGIDAELDPDTLSQGQKQLFSLARAILRERCSVVIMDEVTSSLDSDTEELMMKVIQEAFDGCTIIAIAHRLETILGFDRIAVFDHGEIVEYDDPKTLLSRNDSALSKLVAAGGV